MLDPTLSPATTRILLLGALLSALAGCVVVDDEGSRRSSNGRGSGDSVTEADMMAYCRGEASAEFGVRPQDITTLPVERSGAGFVVYGEYTEGRRTETFQCSFDSQGEFRSVKRG